MKKLFVCLLLTAAVVSPAVAQSHGKPPVEIPLRLAHGRLLIPVVTGDGEELEFMVSTGMPPTIFAESVRARLGEVTSLKMGGISIDLEGAETMPDEQLTFDGVLVDGIVGTQTLNQHDQLIDVPGGRLLLRPAGPPAPWEGYVLSDPVRTQVLHGILIALPVKLDGREYRAMLDLGTDHMVVNTPAGAQLGLEADDTMLLEIGATGYPGLEVRTRDSPILERWDPAGNGFAIVGAPMVYDCALAISWVRSEIRTCVR